MHCFVEYEEGATLAQLCPPSMTFPIQHALLYPERVASVEPALDFTKLLSLEFRPVDETRFPMLRLAKETMATGGCAPAVLNAANEIAVDAFLAERIPFLAIPQLVDTTLQEITFREPTDFADVLFIDSEARRIATAALPNFSN